MIEFYNVSKSYKNVDILKDFNITFDSNKISCLFGPSGIGKTTIANIISGLTEIDSGKILGIENKRISYVFQESRLLEWYTVYENIEYVLKEIYPKDERQKIVKYYIDMVGLSNYKNYKPKQLSGGMAQRVSIARAFAYPSDILIMDEPFKGLDLKLKTELIESFINLWEKSKRTVLFITHDIEEALKIPHIIYMIKNQPASIFKCIYKEKYDNIDNIKEILKN